MLFPSLLPLAAIGWLSATPTEVADASAAAVEQASAELAAQTVEVTLFDINHQETGTVQIGRDGSVDPATRTKLERMFRCKRTERRHAVDDGL